MRVLVIGAGAIGQVFGYHFQRGGAEVAFLVKPRYAEAARAGFTLYPLNRRARDRRSPVTFDGFQVETDEEAGLARPRDLVVFCISTLALMSGEWFERLADATGSTPLLLTQPGQITADFVRRRTSPERTAWAMLSMVSYQAPLPGEQLPRPGVAFWYPPAGPAFGGSEGIVDRVTACLGAGGMPVRRVDNVQRELAFASPVLDAFELAVELSGFSFEALRRDRGLMVLAYRAMRERWAFARAAYGGRRPAALALVRPTTLRWLLRLLERYLPFDPERFLAFHYRKVAEQTLAMQASQIEDARARDTPHEALAELERRLRALRAS